MKYREILELYKEGKLSSEEAEKIEQEIEKQEAIEDFRYSGYEKTVDAGFEDQFDIKATDEISRKIRNAFVKMGITVGVCILIILALFQWVLPFATNIFWYDPAKEINGRYTNQLTEDMSVYSELFLTNGRFTSADVTADGFGEYSFVLEENLYDLRKPITAAGEIKRNKMTIYNPQSLETPYGNAFDWTYYQNQKAKQVYDDAVAKENAKAEDRKEINALSPYETYYAYISFDHLMTYEDAMAFAKETVQCEDAWIAVCCGEEAYLNNLVNVGMYAEPFTESDAKLSDEDRFTKLVKHMKSDKRFAEMTLGTDIDSLIDTDKAFEYIDKNGIRSYGIAVMTDKDMLLKALDKEQVSGIMIDKRR